MWFLDIIRAECILVTWLIPTKYTLELIQKAHADPDFFQKHNILWAATDDDQYLYNSKEEPVNMPGQNMVSTDYYCNANFKVRMGTYIGNVNGLILLVFWVQWTVVNVCDLCDNWNDCVLCVHGMTACTVGLLISFACKNDVYYTMRMYTILDSADVNCLQAADDYGLLIHRV